MKIRMLTSVLGSGILHARNQIYDLPDRLAWQYVAAKFAVREAMNLSEKREKAIRQAAEIR